MEGTNDMKIFVLEDDSECCGVIKWLQNSDNNIKIAKNLEDASYYLEYEDEESYRDYDKFLMDASIPAASVLHSDGTQTEYNDLYNGIDYIADNFKGLGIDMKRVAILTAFALQVEEYLAKKYPDYSIRIISKNDGDLTKQLQEFLHA